MSEGVSFLKAYWNAKNSWYFCKGFSKRKLALLLQKWTSHVCLLLSYWRGTNMTLFSILLVVALEMFQGPALLALRHTATPHLCYTGIPRGVFSELNCFLRYNVIVYHDAWIYSIRTFCGKLSAKVDMGQISWLARLQILYLSIHETKMQKFQWLQSTLKFDLHYRLGRSSSRRCKGNALWSTELAPAQPVDKLITKIQIQKRKSLNHNLSFSFMRAMPLTTRRLFSL